MRVRCLIRRWQPLNTGLLAFICFRDCDFRLRMGPSLPNSSSIGSFLNVPWSSVKHRCAARTPEESDPPRSHRAASLLDIFLLVSLLRPAAVSCPPWELFSSLTFLFPCELEVKCFRELIHQYFLNLRSRNASASCLHCFPGSPVRSCFLRVFDVAN